MKRSSECMYVLVCVWEKASFFVILDHSCNIVSTSFSCSSMLLYVVPPWQQTHLHRPGQWRCCGEWSFLKQVALYSRFRLVLVQTQSCERHAYVVLIGHNFNIWTPPNACRGRMVIWFETCFFVFGSARSFSSLKISTRWTTSKHIQVRAWD